MSAMLNTAMILAMWIGGGIQQAWGENPFSPPRPSESTPELFLAPAPQARPAPPTTTAPAPTKARILFLHHSTGECVWNGGVRDGLEAHNRAEKTDHVITEQAFPKDSPYGWNNYPYDYWNIWVRHAGPKPYQGEPTLEMLTPKYDVIVFKHCFPVSAVEEDDGQGDVASEDKRAANYKLQYEALRKKLREFPRTKFIVWTGAALLKGETDEASAKRAKAFFEWVRRDWDQPGDNVYVWDFRELETEGGLYLKDAHAAGDSHPNEAFSRKVAPLFCRRVVDVIQGRGDTASLTGEGGPKPRVTREASAKTPEEPAPTTTQFAVAPGPDAWVFDDAEEARREQQVWGDGARYAAADGGRAITIRFAEGREEDWGEYGPQRLVATRPPEKNHDLRPYRYLSCRVRVDREMEIVVKLVTRGEGRTGDDDARFSFAAYLHPKPGAWEQVVLDLTKMELGVEGEELYATAGKPTRCEHLTNLQLITNRKNERAVVMVDDITFHRTLPKALADKLQTP